MLKSTRVESRNQRLLVQLSKPNNELICGAAGAQYHARHDIHPAPV